MTCYALASLGACEPSEVATLTAAEAFLVHARGESSSGVRSVPWRPVPRNRGEHQDDPHVHTLSLTSWTTCHCSERTKIGGSASPRLSRRSWSARRTRLRSRRLSIGDQAFFRREGLPRCVSTPRTTTKDRREACTPAPPRALRPLLHVQAGRFRLSSLRPVDRFPASKSLSAEPATDGGILID